MTIDSLMFYLLVLTCIAYVVSAILIKVYTFTGYKNDIIVDMSFVFVLLSFFSIILDVSLLIVVLIFGMDIDEQLTVRWGI